MRYISLFSGIEAASAAWVPFGWEPIVFSEIDPFCNCVLAARFPKVKNAGDIRKTDWRSYRESADIVIGGSPCQSFSVAGKRDGLAGESGLMLEYIRAVREILPRCFVWENVPGALSCEGGQAFGCLLREMDALGYGLAWRILDAQFFGLAQRRERIFLVGVLGDVRRACEILFEPEGLPWGAATSKEKRATLAGAAGDGAVAAGFKYSAGAASGSVAYAPERTPTITADWHCPAVCYGIAANAINRTETSGGHGIGFCNPDEMGMYTLTAADRHAVAYAVRVPGRAGPSSAHSCPPRRGPDEVVGALLASDAKGINGQYINAGKAVVCQCPETIGGFGGDESQARRSADRGDELPRAFSQNMRDEMRLVGGDGSIADALVASPGIKRASHVMQGLAVRRLMPIECERLQGFPDGWTDVEYRGKPAPDTQRYKALGNSMAVPVIRWIGRRIEGAI